jgi:hypothetical protein
MQMLEEGSVVRAIKLDGEEHYDQENTLLGAE